MGRDPRLSQGGFFGVRMPRGERRWCARGVIQPLPSLAALGRGGSCSRHDVSLPAPAHQRLELYPKFSSWGARLKHWCEVTSQGYLRKGLT